MGVSILGVLSAAWLGLGPAQAAAAPPEGAGSAPAVSAEAPPPPRGNPPLVIAWGPLVGPHAFGNEECRSEEARCEKAGAFFGLGLSAELRARIWRVLYGHLRPWVVGNVAPGDRIYRGAAGLGVGIGAYGKHVFGRGEYVVLGAFGDNRFEPPFFDGQVGRDVWGHHAGMLTVGFRRQFPKVMRGRFGMELWGGPMLGPRSRRTVSGQEPEERLLVTFMLGLTASFDVVKDPSPPARRRRAERR